MINITSKGSLYLNVNGDESDKYLEWDIPSGFIQTQYEIMYSRNDTGPWFTTGKIESSVPKYNLTNLSDLVECDFTEFYYKVKVYLTKNISTTETPDSGGSVVTDENTTGSEESNIYTIIFNHGPIGKLNVWGNEKYEYPAFSENTDMINGSFSFKDDESIKKIPLVDESSPIASGTKIKLGGSVKSFAFANGKFKEHQPNPDDTFGYFSVIGSKSYTYTDSYSYISKDEYSYNYASGTYYYKQTYQYGAYKYYSYSTGTQSVKNTGHGTYTPSSLVSAAYLKYSTTYTYSYYGGGGSNTYNAYAYYYTYASGTYNNAFLVSSGGSSSFGQVYNQTPTYAFGPAAYNYTVTGYYTYYTYKTTYAYKTYYYSTSGTKNVLETNYAYMNVPAEYQYNYYGVSTYYNYNYNYSRK